MIRLALAGIGLIGPGLPSWDEALPLLREPSCWVRAVTRVGAPTLLPATERRRAGTVVKASVAVADAACRAAAIDPKSLATVFTSSTGDPVNCHALCEALASSDRLVSPTRFTNSVHNVAAGYWHIATQSMRPSTSLGAFDASVAAGLLEAAVQVAHGGEPVLLVACDVPYPEPLHGVRPLPDTLALALVLLPSATPLTRGLRIAFSTDAATPCDDPALETLRREIPAARALPLLQALARDIAARVVIDAPDNQALAIEIDAAP